MRRTVSNNGILSVESITGVEIVGMPEQPQLLASCGVSCRFLGVVMLQLSISGFRKRFLLSLLMHFGMETCNQLKLQRPSPHT